MVNMANWHYKLLNAVLLASFLFLYLAECKKNKHPVQKPSKNETNLFKFLWLLVYRVVTGFASWFGGQEAIADFMGGILVPPGAEDSEDGGGGSDDDGDYRDHYRDDYKDEDDYY